MKQITEYSLLIGGSAGALLLMLLLFRLSFQAQYKQEQVSWDSEMHIYVEFIWQIYKIDVHV